MFFFFKQIERWLHQHIFKVGWLITQNLHTTTILYYTFFLPGVVLHELILWLVAGILNVRADRAIVMPEKQDIGELKLNFVKINPRTETYKKAIITFSPLIVGVVFIWHVATNIFRVQDFVVTISTGQLSDVSLGFRELGSIPDFWLWFYFVFTVGNTMFPTISKELQPLRLIFIIIIAVVVILSIISVRNQFISTATLPLIGFVSTLQVILLMMIGINLIMTSILGVIEYGIETTTGRSATFRKGKMIAMTREEALAEQEKVRQRATKPQQRVEQDNRVSSIYKLTFPIPNAPGREPVSQMKLTILEDTSDAPIKPSSTPTLLVAEPTTGVRVSAPISLSNSLKELSDGESEESNVISVKPAFPTSPKSLFGARYQDKKDDALDDDSGFDDDDEPPTKPLSSVSAFTPRTSPSALFSSEPDDDDDSEFDDDDEDNLDESGDDAKNDLF